MAIDDAEKRKSISGVNYFSPGVTPNSGQDQEWRQQAGAGYSGILAAGGGGNSLAVLINGGEASIQNGFASRGLSRRNSDWDGLVGSWEPSLGCTGINSLRDFSGYGLHGTMNGSMTLDDWAIGNNSRNKGYYLALEGTDDYIDLGSSSLLEFPTGSFSLSVWIRSTQILSRHVLFYGDTNDQWYSLEQQNTKFAFSIDDDISKSIIVGDPTTNDGVWHLIVGIRNAETGKIYIYVDGLSGTTPATYTAGDISNATQKSVYIGARKRNTSADQWWEGDIGGVRIYNRALGVGEIWDMYHNYKAMYEYVDEYFGIAGEAVGAPTGRIMGALAGYGGLAGMGGIAGQRGGIAA